MGRSRNIELAKYYKTQKCVINNRQCHGESDGDHIKTIGSGGEDCHDNMWALCRIHHIEKHQKGLKAFVEKYPNQTKPILKSKGFKFDEFSKKWIRLTQQGWENE